MNRAVAPIDDFLRMACREGEISTGVAGIRTCCGKAALKCLGKTYILDGSGVAAVPNAFEIAVPLCRRRNPHFKIDD